MQYDHFDVEVREGVARAELCGLGAPALGELGDEFLDLMLRLQTDSEARVVLVTDGDHTFDLPDCRDGLAPESDTANRQRLLTSDLESVRRIVTVIQELGKPVVMATRGAVRGAGLGFYMAGDLRLASVTATFRAPDLICGLLPDWGLTYTLPRLVGPGRALDIIWSHRTVGAEEAARIGLVDRLLEDAAWDDELAAYVARLAALPQPAVRLAKLAAQQAPQFDLTAMLSYEYEAQQLCLESRETAEGLAAWQEGRPPIYQPPIPEDGED